MLISAAHSILEACVYVILYSRKLSREKTFANFVVLGLSTKVFSLESFPLYGIVCPIIVYSRPVYITCVDLPGV